MNKLMATQDSCVKCNFVAPFRLEKQASTCVA